LTRIKAKLRALVHSTESEEKVMRALENLGVPKENIRREETKGHFNNPIVILEAEIQGKEALELLRSIVSKEGTSLANLEGKRFYVRVDKVEAYLGRLVPSSRGETIRIVFYSNEEIEKVIKNVL